MIILPMMRVFIFLFYCIFFTSTLIAQTTEEERRIEEEKRQSLRPTETGISEGEITPKPIAPVEFVYFAELMARKIAFRYDACRTIIILMGMEEKYKDLGSQIRFLKERHIIPERLEQNFEPMEPLRKGLAAYMFCKVLDIKGGLCLRLFGMNERYALKELVYQKIMASGNVKDIVSGEELISILMRAANYMARKKADDK